MTPVLELIHAFRRSKVMFTAVRLGIFDRLETARKPPPNSPSRYISIPPRLLACSTPAARSIC